MRLRKLNVEEAYGLDEKGLTYCCGCPLVYYSSGRIVKDRMDYGTGFDVRTHCSKHKAEMTEEAKQHVTL